MRYLLKMSREVYLCYEGNTLQRPIGRIGDRNIDETRNAFLKSYLDFIMSNKVVSETTRIYIRSTLTHSASVAAIINDFNETLSEGEGKKINVKKAQNQIDYDYKKLIKRFKFPDDMLNKVTTNSECNLDFYNEKLSLAIDQYTGKNKLLDSLKLKLPIVKIQDSLDEDKFFDLLGMLSPYFSKHIKYLEENLPENAVGYMKYLLSTPTQQLTGEHKERYQLLREMLE